MWVASKSWKGKEMDSPLELPKGMDALILASETYVGPLTYKITFSNFVLFEATKSVVTCYSNNRSTM